MTTNNFALDSRSEKIVRFSALAAATLLGAPLVMFLIGPFVI